jgi:ABC-type phosphate/phosphonate transport system substrate-binding protein
MTIYLRLFLCAALLAISVAAGACRDQASSGGASGGQRAATLRVSMIPTTDPGKVLRESQPLVPRERDPNVASLFKSGRA